MPRIKIKQLDERIATSGLHFGGDLRRRKLQPGEVVEIPEDLLLENGTPLLGAMLATGKVELTLDPANRPLDFASIDEAKLTSPTFRSRGPEDDRNVERARQAVAARLAQPSEPAKPAKATRKQAAPPVDDDEPSADPDVSTARNRRAERRAALRAANGQANPT